MRSAVHALLRFAIAAAFAAAAPTPASASASAQSPSAPYRLDWLGPEFYPHALNDRGQVVGYNITRGVPGPALQWQDGTVIDLGPGEAQDINNAGQIVIAGSDPARPAVVRQPDGTHTPVDVARPWGSDFRHQYSINDRGQVVGMVSVSDTNPDGRAFIWDNGTVTYLDLGLPQAPARVSAHGVNNDGAAVGWWSGATTGRTWAGRSRNR